MKVYVEKTIRNSPISLIGPFDTRAQADHFIERALVEEAKMAATHINSKSVWYTDVRYRIISEGQIDC